MNPLVSVVVPVFNGLPHIKALVASLQRQTYSHLEVIFTEGGGTDASIDFLRDIDDQRFRVIQMPKGTSAAANWTAATSAARGDLTKLVCQDDVLYPHAVEVQVQDLLAHPDAVMAIAQRDIIDARGNILFARRGLAGLSNIGGAKNGVVAAIPGAQVIRTCYLQGTNVIGEPLTVLFRTAAVASGMPWNDSNPLMLDLSTYEKVAPRGDVVVRWESIGAFRVSASSWSTKIARKQLEQTRQWQDRYASTAEPTITSAERRSAAVGRHKQTALRRAAYAVLRAKGAFATDGASQ